ncbi:hypothetical protein BS47DRAFT_1378504 [Hydnum rufescens UP504]|uniref:Nuclear speckle splicing regulatory protein 1 N-terminal domain-containing protein n=1 Tax=Hydnum rufescens UP504 TaxID=1448309 RepID=A0A9P6E017_9AGAM|nr:hypothetical protein BS47DRAFT_1378504 [Hydnum rufescens UP504]
MLLPRQSTSSALDVNRHLAAQNISTSTSGGSLSRTAKRKMQQELAVDPTVYQYDEVFDRMKEAQIKAKTTKEQESQERKPKYIGALLTTAATRKLDYIRAEEKLIQREREMEGNEFADKEKFVTQAYKDQMAEVRRAEEEEKKREELERSKKGTTGMTHFYRELLQKSEVEHAATVAAMSSSSGVKGPTLPNEPVNLTISKPLKPAVKSDALLAHLAREEGKQIELNDDNQIVDKRELLSAGLNLSGVNTRRLGGLLSSRSKGGQSEPVETHRAAGTAASKKEIRERQARLLERQLAEEQERIAQIKEMREAEERERVVKKRNNEEEVQSARQRYLERKRRKVEAESTETSPTVADTG